MKQILFASLVLFCSFRSMAGTPEKVLQAFSKTFPNATNVSWIDAQQSYEASFRQDEISLRIVYDKDGSILRTIRSYYESQLPIFIGSKVKSRFPDKKIFGVTELSSADGVEYYITLEDDKNWMDIKADGGGMITVQKKFKKG